MTNRISVLTNSGTNFGKTINHYKGCSHGCIYCYAWDIKNWQCGFKGQTCGYEDWIKPTHPQNVLSDLQQQIAIMRPSTKADIKDIFVSSLTDCYQPAESQLALTRDIILTLKANNLPFTVLTKNAGVLRDVNLFQGYEKCRVGMTVITLDDGLRQILEPHASPIADRIDALKQLKGAGVSTYCSVEPIMPDKRVDPIAIANALKNDVDLFEFGIWNAKATSRLRVEQALGIQYNQSYFASVMQGIDNHCRQNGINYCFAGHSREFIERIGITFIPCPAVIP